MERVSQLSGTQFRVSELERELRVKFGVPQPTCTPPERMRHLMAFNNYLNLFRSTCAATGEKQLQVFRSTVPFPVYSVPFWWSDQWDAIRYSRPYDFSRTFFAQFADLARVVPRPALSINYATLENCDYVSGCSYSKNCYLIFSSVSCDDCSFGYFGRRSRDCIDCVAFFDCELCYDSTFIFSCYDVRHSFNARSCCSSSWIWNCISCEECFCCVNLKQKKHCFFNEQLSEKAYRDRLAGIRFDDCNETAKWQKAFLEFVRQYPQPAIRGRFLEDATGDCLDHCRQVERCFQSSELENCVNCVQVEKAKDCLDLYTWGAGAELIYNTSRAGTNAYNVRCSHVVYAGSSDIEYCMNCIGCTSCFGCMGLKHKEFCILNQQYSKEEYQELRRRIIAQMNTAPPGEGAYGDFFPYSLSGYPYNDSDAMIFFPTDEAAVQQWGGHWDSTEPEEKVQPTIAWFAIASRTADIKDEILQHILGCERTGKPFRITASELAAYRKRSLPLPRLHWQTRMKDRIDLLHAPDLHTRVCAKTGATLQTSFAPDAPWLVWDADAYSSFALS